MFVLARLSTFALDADRVITDTLGYARVADHSLRERGFWAGERPFTVPVVYKVMGLSSETLSNPDQVRRVTLFQISFAMVAWGTLAASVSWAASTGWLRATSLVLVLAFASTLDVAQWDRILLSESISMSLFVLLLAGWIIGIRYWGFAQEPPKVIWLVAYVAGMAMVTVLFSFSRDTNAFLLLAGAILLGATTITRRIWREPLRWVVLFLSLVMALTYVVQDRTIVHSKRWVGPFLNVFSARILPVDDFVRFFEEHGLPVDTITQEMFLGRSVLLSQVNDTQEGRRLKDWIEQEGRSVYLQFLISRPVQTLGKPLLRARSIFNPDSSEYRLPQHPNPVWAQVISGVFFPKKVEILFVLAIASVVALAFARRVQGTEPLLLAAIGLLVLAYPLALLVWHGDSIELERHSQLVALQVRIAAWLLLIGVLSSAGRTSSGDKQKSALSMEERRGGNAPC